MGDIKKKFKIMLSTSLVFHYVLLKGVKKNIFLPNIIMGIK